MLHRRDLTDQFSDIVKQEIKENQEARLANNLEINSIREQVVHLSAQLSKRIAKIESELVYEQVKSAEFKKILNAEIFKVDNTLKRFDDLVKETRARYDIFSNHIKQNVVKANEFSEKFDILFDLDLQKADEIQDIFKTISTETNRLEQKLTNKIDKARQAILSAPTPIYDIRDNLLGEISHTNDNFAGMSTELMAVKKSLYILRKELENVHNLIDRISNKKEQGS